MGYSEEMKRNRLVFYEAEINEINEILEEFIDRTQAKSVLVIDKEGHLVTRKGFTQTIDTTSISALVAGSFASTREVAKMLGEEEFSMIFHQGKKESIHVSLINERCMSVIIFDDRTTVGMIRIFAQELSDKLSAVFEKAAKKQPTGDEPDIGEEFHSEATDKLDDFFSE